MNRLLYINILLLILCSCAHHGDGGKIEDYDVHLYTPAWATGLDILGKDRAESSIIVCRAPWQGAEDADAAMLFISRNGEEAPEGFQGQVIDGEAKRIVCMSSTYIAMLDAIGEVDRVAGVSGWDFVNNAAVKARTDVPDVGYDNNFDYEALVALEPDLVLLYGVTGASQMEGKLRELGIPFAYIGEYLEEHPLGKAEWMIAIGEIAGQREKAEQRFAEIAPNYLAMSENAQHLENHPKVMINTPYADSWVMASPTSYMAQLIKDAGGIYVYENHTNQTGRTSQTNPASNTSKPIDIEEAYMLTDGADLWINVGKYTTLKDLTAAFPKFASAAPVRRGDVWNCTLRNNPQGGNDYWESGIVNPDLVLADLIKIFHPGELDSIPFTYYQKVE